MKTSKECCTGWEVEKCVLFCGQADGRNQVISIFCLPQLPMCNSSLHFMLHNKHTRLVYRWCRYQYCQFLIRAILIRYTKQTRNNDYMFIYARGNDPCPIDRSACLFSHVINSTTTKFNPDNPCTSSNTCDVESNKAYGIIPVGMFCKPLHIHIQQRWYSLHGQPVRMLCHVPWFQVWF